jgi:hypothetical protein
MGGGWGARIGEASGCGQSDLTACPVTLGEEDHHRTLYVKHVYAGPYVNQFTWATRPVAANSYARVWSQLRDNPGIRRWRGAAGLLVLHRHGFSAGALVAAIFGKPRRLGP